MRMRRADASEWRNVCGNKNDLSSRKEESVKERERDCKRKKKKERNKRKKNRGLSATIVLG